MTGAVNQNQGAGAASGEHYEVRQNAAGEYKLHIGGKACTVTIGGQIILDRDQLEKLAKTFRKTVEQKSIEQGETWKLTPKGIEVSGSAQPKSVKVLSNDIFTRRMEKFLAANDPAAKTAKKADDVAQNTPPIAPVPEGSSPPPNRPPPPPPPGANKPHGDAIDLGSEEAEVAKKPVDEPLPHAAAHDLDDDRPAVPLHDEVPPEPPPRDDELPSGLVIHVDDAPPPPPDDEIYSAGTPPPASSKTEEAALPLPEVLEDSATEEVHVEELSAGHEDELAEKLNDRAAKVADDLPKVSDDIANLIGSRRGSLEDEDEVEVDEAIDEPPPPPPRDDDASVAEAPPPPPPPDDDVSVAGAPPPPPPAASASKSPGVAAPVGSLADQIGSVKLKKTPDVEKTSKPVEKEGEDSGIVDSLAKALGNMRGSPPTQRKADEGKTPDATKEKPAVDDDEWK